MLSLMIALDTQSFQAPKPVILLLSAQANKPATVLFLYPKETKKQKWVKEKWIYLQFGLIERTGDLRADIRVLESHVPEQGAKQSDAMALEAKVVQHVITHSQVGGHQAGTERIQQLHCLLYKMLSFYVTLVGLAHLHNVRFLPYLHSMGFSVYTLPGIYNSMPSFMAPKLLAILNLYPRIVWSVL